MTTATLETIARANALAAAQLEDFCGSWLPGGRKNGGEFEAPCFSHAERTASLKINLGGKRGMWKCFGCGIGGGDAVSLLAAVRGIGQLAAAREILGETGQEGRKERAPLPPPPKKLEWIAQPAAPAGAKLPDMRHPHRGEPVLLNGKPAVWIYHRADGAVAGLIGRYAKSDGGKDICPQTWCKHEDGQRIGWRWKAMAEPRPLFRLHTLTKYPAAAVVLVEGEKCAEALAKAIEKAAAVEGQPKYLVSTWAGGGKALGKTDFAALAGRTVILWPDADVPGRTAMKEIAWKLHESGCKLAVVDVPHDVPKGWDCADAILDGEDVLAMVEGAFGKAEMLKAETLKEEDGGAEPPQGGGLAPAPRRVSDLPFRCLGMAGDKYYYLPDNGGQVLWTTAAGHNKNLFFQLAPLDAWADAFGLHWDGVTSSLLQRQAALPKFDVRRIRGRGCWVDGKEIVYHAGDRLFVVGAEGEGQFRTASIAEYESGEGAVYSASLEIGVDAGEALSNVDAARLLNVIRWLPWEDKLSGLLLAGWLALAPVCGSVFWRPHIWLTGPSGSGKSWIMTNIVAPLVGGASVVVQGASTEAGVRGQLGCDALPVIFDENESSDERSRHRVDNVLELARQASSEGGAVILKGTAAGGSVAYRVRSMFCFSSIGVAAVKKADTSRITVLNLSVRRDENVFRQLSAEVSETSGNAAFASRFRARSLRGAARMRRNAAVLSDAVARKLGDKRLGDQLGTLLAGAYSLEKSDLLDADAAAAWVAKLDWSAWMPCDLERDEAQCWNHLLSAVVRVDGGGNVRSIGELINESLATAIGMTDDSAAVLLRHGIKIDRDAARLVVANSHPGLEFIFEATPWGGGKWKQMLARLDGAERSEVERFGPLVRQRAVSVPIPEAEPAVNPYDAAMERLAV